MSESKDTYNGGYKLNFDGVEVPISDQIWESMSILATKKGRTIQEEFEEAFSTPPKDPPNDDFLALSS